MGQMSSLCAYKHTKLILCNASASTRGSLFASDCAQTGAETAEEKNEVGVAAMYGAILNYNLNPCTFQAVVMLRDAVKRHHRQLHGAATTHRNLPQVDQL